MFSLKGRLAYPNSEYLGLRISKYSNIQVSEYPSIRILSIEAIAVVMAAIA
jgi:hypothetical protein